MLYIMLYLILYSSYSSDLSSLLPLPLPNPLSSIPFPHLPSFIFPSFPNLSPLSYSSLHSQTIIPYTYISSSDPLPLSIFHRDSDPACFIGVDG